MATQQDDKKFKCPRCGTGTNLKTNLISHLKNKTPCEPKISNISIADALNFFKKKETKLKQLECLHCHKMITKRNMKRHIEISHSNIENNTQQTETNDSESFRDNKTKPCNITHKSPVISHDVIALAKEIHRLSCENEELKKTIQDTEDKHVKIILNITDSETTKLKKKRKISKAVKAACWNKCVGREKGTSICPCCNTHTISTFDFHCGHIIAHCYGGKTTLENLRPICSTCNLSMSAINMRDFAKEFFNIDIV
jgi:hypothetical protein